MQAATRIPTTEPGPEWGNITFYIIGAALVVSTLYIRRSHFWFPHSIGLIMLMNPQMSQMWFSYFIGWIFKRAVVKYGGKTTFDKTRLFFIGLIMGELIAIFIWQILRITFDIQVGWNISLSRWTP